MDLRAVGIGARGDCNGGERMTKPKWKQRQLESNAELEAAERAERYRQFWESIEKPQHDWPRDANGSPLDWEQLPV